MSTYRITADEDSTTERTTTLFERARGGLGKSWTVTSVHQWGTVHTDVPNEDETIVCDPRLGYVLGQTLEMSFTFDDGITDREREEIRSGWSYAQSYGIDLARWTIEEDYIVVSNPANVELTAEERTIEYADEL